MYQERLPLSEKFGLSIKEASEYFGIGIKKMRQLAEKNQEEFAVFSGNRFIIIRPKFEEYLLNCSFEKEEIGKPVKRPVLEEKSLLTVDETARSYHFSRRKLAEFLNQAEDYPFIVFYRKRKLIVRDEFDAYLKKHPEVKETLHEKT